jgi:uncharacterized protein
MSPDLAWWAVAGLACVLIGVSKTGIPGVGMLFVVIFAELLPAREASGFALPLLLAADLVAVRAYWRHTEWRHLARVFPWTALGIVLGAAALGQIDDGQARRLVGAIIVVLTVLQVLRRIRLERAKKAAGADPRAAEEPAPGPWFAPVIGILAGFTTLVANAAGPLMALYLLTLRLPKMAFIGTTAVFFLCNNIFKLPFMAGLGFVTPDSLVLNAWLLPAVLLGAGLGRWILPRISQLWFERIALGLSFLAGLRLVLA